MFTAARALAAETGKRPSPEEIAERTGLTAAAVRRWLRSEYRARRPDALARGRPAPGGWFETARLRDVRTASLSPLWGPKEGGWVTCSNILWREVC